VLDIGWPADLTWYRLLTEWGGLIGGILALIAGAALALGAYYQLQTFKQFELLKILEARPVRKARHLLWHRLQQPKEEPPLHWWTDNDDLEEAASSVCASFDIVGIIARGRNWKFFTKEWAHPICWTYESLQEYIRMRNPNGYHGYRALYKAAKKHHHSAPTPN